MSELPNKSPESEQAILRLATTQTRLNIHGFCDNEPNTESAPRGLFVSLPGRTVTIPDYVDNGCRGGWATSYKQILDATPYEIKLIKKTHRENELELSIRIGDGIANPIKLPRDALDNIAFFEQPSDNEEGDFDAALKRVLTSSSFVSVRDHELSPNWSHGVRVRAKDPLAHPVSNHTTRYERRVHSLDSSFASVVTYFDSELSQTMAQVIIGSEDRELTSSTEWVPLDQLEFYQVELRKNHALAAELYTVASKLIAGQTGVAQINDLLAANSGQVVYPLLRDRWHEYYNQPFRAPFVLGRVATDGTISHPFVPMLGLGDQNRLYPPYLRAHKVVMVETQPWLIDEAIAIATPLTSPTFDPLSRGWDVPIEKIAPELATSPDEVSD